MLANTILHPRLFGHIKFHLYPRVNYSVAPIERLYAFQVGNNLAIFRDRAFITEAFGIGIPASC